MRRPLSKRDLASEVAKFFRGTPESRLADALRPDPLATELHLAGSAKGSTREEAARLARLATHAGRRPSRVMSLPRG